jgi:uncharacterized protein YkwD
MLVSIAVEVYHIKMKIIRFVLVLTMLLVFQSCGSSTSSQPIDSPQNPTIESFVEIMNAHRVSLGCPALTWHAKLAGVAQDHSDDMNENAYLSHDNLQGESPFDRMNANDLEYSAAAENVAFNSEGAQGVFDAWMESAGHKANIENCVYTHHGLGLSGSYWTHMFMKP